MMVEIVAEERSLLIKKKSMPAEGLLRGSRLTSTRVAKLSEFNTVKSSESIE